MGERGGMAKALAAAAAPRCLQLGLWGADARAGGCAETGESGCALSRAAERAGPRDRRRRGFVRVVFGVPEGLRRR